MPHAASASSHTSSRSSSPRSDADGVVARFASLPTIVTVLERERAACGRAHAGRRAGDARRRRAGDVRHGALPRDGLAPSTCARSSRCPDAPDEDAVFERLGLPYCPPELREAAGAQAPADLVERPSIRGDLHCHTTWSDGRAHASTRWRSRRASAATSTSRSATTRRTCASFRGSARRICVARPRRSPRSTSSSHRSASFAVSSATSAPTARSTSRTTCSRELEWVQLSLHAGQRRSRGELTRMVTEAMRHPAVSALSHPKGRILNHRPENALDLDEVFAVATEEGVAVEVNGLPDRLDLSATHVRDALAVGRRPRAQLGLALGAGPRESRSRRGDRTEGWRDGLVRRQLPTARGRVRAQTLSDLECGFGALGCAGIRAV